MRVFSAARIASIAFGDGPIGFSFEASLMIVLWIDAEFACRFLDRFPRLVNSEVAQLGIRQFPDRSHAREIRCEGGNFAIRAINQPEVETA